MEALLIVESPNKAKKIAGFLPGFTVLATVGHFRDLPKQAMGVEPPEFRPQYVVSEGKAGIIKRIKSAAAQADAIYIGTDLDREGEAIAWHVESLLNKAEKARAKRVRYGEVTAAAIKRAIREATAIDYALVAAQEARRVIDRLVGYTVSPALSDRLQLKGLSAGRVQSVALKLMVEREQHREGFKPVDHYAVVLSLVHDGQAFSAVWDFSGHLKDGETLLRDKALAEAVAARNSQGEVVVSTLERQEKPVAPPKPLITATYMQGCSKRFRLSAKKAMQIAQALFEAGLITYHRTDSPAMDPDFARVVRQFALDASLPVPEQPPAYQAKAGAQEAHEGIRVTDITLDKPPELDAAALQVYRWLRYHTLASQLAPGRDAHTVATLLSPHLDRFVARGVRVLEPGWRAIKDHPNLGMAGFVPGEQPAGGKGDDGDKQDKDAAAPNAQLPPLMEEQAVAVTGAAVQAKQTRPKPRFTQSTMIKELERCGVGRPSTYASIIETLLYRRYIDEHRQQLIPTGRGRVVCAALDGAFAFMDVAYTAGVEAELDAVASRRRNYVEVVAAVHAGLARETGAFAGVVEGKLDATLRESLAALRAAEAAPGGKGGTPRGGKRKPQACKQGDPCPKCGKGKVTYRVIQTGKNQGKEMYGCSQYRKTPHCDFFRWGDNG